VWWLQMLTSTLVCVVSLTLHTDSLVFDCLLLSVILTVVSEFRCKTFMVNHAILSSVKIVDLFRLLIRL